MVQRPKKCYLLINEYSHVNGLGERFVLGVFSDIKLAEKELKRFCKVSNCKWEQDSDHSYVRLRKTKFREGSDEYTFLEECSLDSVCEAIWKDRINPKELISG